jgi:hypothetical protein
VDDVTVRHVDNGFGLVAASACTLRHTRVAGRGAHHPYFCREDSHDNLIEDFTIEARTTPAPVGTQLHGIDIDVPDFAGDLHSRLELYGTTDAVRPRNLYDAQRALPR